MQFLTAHQDPTITNESLQVESAQDEGCIVGITSGMYDGDYCKWLKLAHLEEAIGLSIQHDLFARIETGDIINFTATREPQHRWIVQDAHIVELATA